MLEQAGYVAASPAEAAAEDADVIVINTCAVRENAADKLYGNLGRLAGTKRARPGHADRGRRLPRAEGPRGHRRAGAVGRRRLRHAQPRRPAGPARARAPQRRGAGRDRGVAQGLPVARCPTRRESVYAGWVSISVGCNNTCTFCIVPHLRGKERDRRPGEILAEVEALVGPGRHRGDAARAERELLRRRVRRPRRVRQAAARRGRDRGPRAGAVHVARTRPRSPTTSSRRWPQTPDRHAAAAHAAAVGLRPHPARDAPLVPVGQVPRHPRPRAGRDAGRGDHHRHHRRLPRGDRGGLRGDAARRRGVPVRLGVHVPVLAAPGHRRRSTCPTSCPRRSSRSATCGSRPCRTASRTRRTRRRSAAPSRCSSPRPRAARTARRTGVTGRAADNRLVHLAAARPAAATCPARVTW